MKVESRMPAPASKDSRLEAEPKKTSSSKIVHKKPGAGRDDEDDGADTKVTLSARKKDAEPTSASVKDRAAASATKSKSEAKGAKKTDSSASADPELDQAGILADHIESGKLSKDERDLAVKRLGDIVKKYGSS